MDRQSRLIIAVAIFSLTLTQNAAAQQGEFESLFNGKDLSGWKGDTNVWSVEDGVIVGRTTAEDPIDDNTFLIFQGEDLADFELKLEYKLESGNSGVQYRSQVVDAEKWRVGGYQADMEAGPNYTGILYDELGRGILAQRGESVVLDNDGERSVSSIGDKDELQEAIHQDQWNEYVISARGNVLTHTINGQVMSKCKDLNKDERERSGVLALQVHRGPPMTVRFRNLRLKRLKDTSQAAAATPEEAISVAEGFQVELIHSVTRDQRGSWINLTTDPQGRLIVSSEDGHLYRVTPPPIGHNDSPQIEQLSIDVGPAQGLLCAHGDLYVVVNNYGRDEKPCGLYRIRDTDGNDQWDEAELLQALEGAGEHGPHAVVLGPSGQDLYVVGGNHTLPPPTEKSLVPRVWEEDQLLPRFFDAGGHAVGIRAPAGWICRTDLDGSTWELVSIGYRNPFDIAFNAVGELFTYDADMEWDIGAPWYRPTRVCHVTSGSEFGWRTGTGKWPEYYPDSVPAALDVGPGSPTGITFGYEARFPERYRNSLFVCDWSFGTVHSVVFQPDGASYGGSIEPFLTGTPLPLTDVVINPHDGAMYFTVGGRGTQSGLYRVTYTGQEITDGTPSEAAAGNSLPAEFALRDRLEAFHGRTDPQAVDVAWPALSHPDRMIRFAARTAVEWQPVESWRDRALAEEETPTLLEAMVALARHGAKDDGSLPVQMVDALRQLSWGALSIDQRLALLRTYGLVFIRLPAAENTEVCKTVFDELDSKLPSGHASVDRELSSLLLYLNAPATIDRVLDLLANAPTQEQQIHYALVLHSFIGGASAEQQEAYFKWFEQGGTFRGGHSLRKYIQNIKQAAADELTPSRREELAELLDVEQETTPVAEQPTRPLVAEYTTDQVLELARGGLDDCDTERGRQLFSKAQCFQCHRIGNEGGATGPDLTALAHRFSLRDVVEAVVEPDQFVADRFRQTMFMLEDGRVVIGRVANHSGQRLMVVTDMLAPGDFTELNRDEIEFSELVETSQMPTGLLNTFTKQEVRDLLAYILQERGPATVAVGK